MKDIVKRDSKEVVEEDEDGVRMERPSRDRIPTLSLHDDGYGEIGELD
jgi:hypothetical protein